MPNFSFSQPTARQEKNLTAFTKLYGYIRFFHPSDETRKIDWERFAIYGNQEVMNAKNDADLVFKLQQVFYPIAPSIKIFLTDRPKQFSKSEITPLQSKKFKIISWQHLGFQLPYSSTAYSSIRLNRSLLTEKKKKQNAEFYPLSQPLSLSQFKGKEFFFSVLMEGDSSDFGPGALIVNALSGSVKYPFSLLSKEKHINHKKKRYNFYGRISNEPKKNIFGVLLKGDERISIDSPKLFIEEGARKIEIPLLNGRSDDATIDTQLAPVKYAFEIIPVNNVDGIKGVDHALFKKHTQIGEYIEKELVPHIKCIVPLALYGDDTVTYPKADTLLTEQLKKNIFSKMPVNMEEISLPIRLGDIIITWNIFKHSFPYWEDSSQTAETILHNAFHKAFTDRTTDDFLTTLKLMCEPLNDGHMFTSYSGDANGPKLAALPLIFSKVQEEIVIKEVLDVKLKAFVNLGDIVDSIGNQPALEVMYLKEKLVSGSAQWKQYKALLNLSDGTRNDSLVLSLRYNGKNRQIRVRRSIGSVEHRPGAIPNHTIPDGHIKSNLFYFNLSKDSIMSKINGLMDQLVDARAIIFDLRGYPTGDITDIISHLLIRGEDTKWIHTPEIIYPDYEKVTYESNGWNLLPKSPYLKAKIYFLADASAMSYSESFLGFIKDLKLGTIVGQPTSGTNGNLQTIYLPGNYRVFFSGMKITNHDGSKHHLTGIVPDILINPTLEGIKSSRDEVLDKAIELAEKN